MNKPQTWEERCFLQDGVMKMQGVTLESWRTLCTWFIIFNQFSTNTISSFVVLRDESLPTFKMKSLGGEPGWRGTEQAHAALNYSGGVLGKGAAAQ